MRFRFILAVLSVVVVTASCGFDDMEVDFDTIDDDSDDSCQEDQDQCQDSPPGLVPPDGADDHSVSTYPPSEQSDLSPGSEGRDSEGGTEGQEEQEDLLEEEETTNFDDDQDWENDISEPDLQCADDPDICRFCGPAQAVITDCSDGDTSFACQVFELVNETRVDHGLHPLDYDGTLAESAMIHAMDLSLCDYFAHDSLDGTTFFERCAENGYPGTCTGENIGGGQTSPQSVMDAWMASPGHRHNILYEHHTEVGISFYEGGGNYSRYWVKHFGRR